MDKQVKKAIKILNQGGIIIYPTDTAFGIGCRIDNEEAVARLFEIRKRPKTQAVPVLVSSVGMAGEYVQAIEEPVQKKLLAQYWPGALTVVLPAKTEKIHSLVRGGTDTVGVRMPNHDITLALIHNVSVPILGPSANFSGGKTPYEFEDLDRELIKLVDFVLPGECTVKYHSTVIDCTLQPWKLIRKGAVDVVV